MARKMRLLDGPEELLQYMDIKEIPEPWHGEIQEKLKEQQQDANQWDRRGDRSERT